MTKSSLVQRYNLAVHGVVEAVYVNHDGASNGLTAPNPCAQTDLLKLCFSKAQCDIHGLTYIEAHGTGTPLGDPIELTALSSALNDGGISQPCRIGSVKSNIGHTEAVAGLAGLIKVLLSFKHGVVPGNINFNQLNANLQGMDEHLSIADKPIAWQLATGSRYAGVSSFGLSGTNAHACRIDIPADQHHAMQISIRHKATCYVYQLCHLRR